MNGDIIIHAVEVKEYTRTLPNGKTITVKAYKRSGSAYNDAVNAASKKMIDAYGKHGDARKRYVRAEREREAGLERYKQYADTTGEVHRTEYNRYRQLVEQSHAAAAEYESTLKEILAAEKEHNDVLASKYSEAANRRYTAIDVKEDIQVAVGNFLEETKAKAQEVGAIIEGASQQIVDTVRDGWNAVKSFFGGLFGRR